RSAVPVAVAFARPGAASARGRIVLARPAAHRAATDDVAVDIIPLPHTTTIQLVAALDGADVERFPDVVPTATSVAKGWEAQAGRGVRIDLPDPRLEGALAASRCQLLLGELGDGRLLEDGDERSWARAGVVVRALDRVGLQPEAERVLLRLATDGRPDDPGAALVALD